MQRVLAWAAGAAVCLGAASSHAATPADVIAYYCSSSDFECTTAPIAYEKTIELPVAFDWDTGWIPQGSDLQVRFFVKLPASTTVKLDGFLDTTWPEAMTLATPGGHTGLLEFDYGLEIGGQAKLDVNVLGIPVKWTGDLPYVPQVNFHMTGQTSFEPWAFAPNVATANGTSPKVRVYDINLLELAGIPSQISKGGIAVDIQGELDATYETQRIRIDPADPGDTDILSETGTTTRAFAGGPFVEYDVWPEGVVSYVGTLHIIPAFFVEVLGKDFSLPIFDFPIPVELGDQDFVFDPVRVHVPLPDLLEVVQVLDFGQVAVGDDKTLPIAVSNVGEAKARATGFIDLTTTKAFGLVTSEAIIDSMASKDVTVRFTPEHSGAVETTLTFVTNDPDTRFQTVTLRGVGTGGSTPPPPVDGGPTEGEPEAEAGDPSGCGCRSVGADPSGAGWLLALAAACMVCVRRRKL